MLDHGGRLRDAARRYGTPLAQWLDLSTGINPWPWPVPALSPACWQHLPEEDDGLEAAGAAYYGNPRLLPVAGSQAAIQVLPRLFPPAAVACIAPLYNEHPQAWSRAGHRVRLLQQATLTRALAAATPILLLCNPNNPTGHRHDADQLLAAATQLARRGGWLVVDEAFADCDPAASVVSLAGSAEAPNLVVLRSLGKFFGLAGARIGFVCAAPDLLQRLQELLGPWTVSGPAREAARQALADRDWQAAARRRLEETGARLAALLQPLGPVQSTHLFATLTTPDSHALHTFLAERGILTRAFPDLPLLRLGLPGTSAEWQRLAAALDAWHPTHPAGEPARPAAHRQD